jgi:hypothetical protein
MPKLTNIYMLRKPLEGTVASCALKWGTGSLNIDATRVGPPTDTTRNNGPTMGYGGCTENYSGGVTNQGRWPANVILQHRANCVQEGTRKVKAAGWKDKDIAPPTPTGSTNNFGADGMTGRHYGENGAETMANWHCGEGCPVADLDLQSGLSKAGTAGMQSRGWGLAGHTIRKYEAHAPASFNDFGGASRFFHQVQSYEQLVDYLVAMASTPDHHADYAEDIIHYVCGQEPNGVTGLVFRGPIPEHNPHLLAGLLEALKPGGHVFYIAPDDCPTGHKGAIALEDAGFEVRDCILWVREAGRYHYVSKANRKEREAGCEHLPGKSGAEAVARKEGSAAMDCPRTGAGRTAKHVKNYHPTVKCIAIMERLLQDVPSDAVVLDPFMGSGTTAIACTRSGHSFVGVEREANYFAIADARVRHWDRKEAGWLGATIESDLDDAEKEDAQPVWSMDDFLLG